MDVPGANAKRSEIEQAHTAGAIKVLPSSHHFLLAASRFRRISLGRRGRRIFRVKEAWDGFSILTLGWDVHFHWRRLYLSELRCSWLRQDDVSPVYGRILAFMSGQGKREGAGRGKGSVWVLFPSGTRRRFGFVSGARVRLFPNGKWFNHVSVGIYLSFLLSCFPPLGRVFSALSLEFWVPLFFLWLD
jgi:hypothetical protein